MKTTSGERTLTWHETRSIAPARGRGGGVVRRPLTEVEAAHLKCSQEEVEALKEEIAAEGRKVKAAVKAGEAALDQAMRVLNAERERQGLSFADMQARTGIAAAR